VFRAALEVGGGDAQSQRQVRADVAEARHGGRFPADPSVTEHAGQQRCRLRRGQHIERDADGAIARRQTIELMAARHQRQASGPAGQQRSDLLGVECVVEHDQHARVHHPSAEGRGGSVHIGR